MPSLLSIRALTLSACPLSFIILAHDLGSQTLRTLSVDPLTMTVPEGFMARLKKKTDKKKLVKSLHLDLYVLCFDEKNRMEFMASENNNQETL